MLVPRVIHNSPIIRSDGIGATDGRKKANQLRRQEYHRDHQMKKSLGAQTMQLYGQFEVVYCWG